MGFDLINEVKSRIKSNFNGTLKPNYRTSVLNDFSIVTKAVFHVVQLFTEGNGSRYEITETLPVQINPDNIRMEHSVDLSGAKGLRLSTTDPTEMNRSTETSQRSNLRLDLDYDIYDEYIMRTGGAGIASSIVDSSVGNVSLKNENFTSLPKLIQTAQAANRYVIFKWGEIEYFGIITEITPNYVTFSRYGEPLKAKVEVNIAKQDIIGVMDFHNAIANKDSLQNNKKVETAKKVFLGITGALR